MKEKEEKTLTKTNDTQNTNKKSSVYGNNQPEQLHCRRCQALVENGVCHTCGFKMYVPMSEEKRKKIKLITTAIGFAVFIVILTPVFLKMKESGMPF